MVPRRIEVIAKRQSTVAGYQSIAVLGAANSGRDRALVAATIRRHSRRKNTTEAAYQGTISSKRYGKGGDNSKLKAWAITTLPTLQHHLDMAEGLDR